MAFAETALQGVGLRIAASVIIVLLSYNPTGYSYFHWILAGFETQVALKVLAGVLLLTSYVVLLRSTFFSIGAAGIVLVGGIIAAIVWVMIDWGVLSLQSEGVLEWIILFGIGVILGVGLSWGLIRRRLSGQVTVDDVEETQ